MALHRGTHDNKAKLYTCTLQMGQSFGSGSTKSTAKKRASSLRSEQPKHGEEKADSQTEDKDKHRTLRISGKWIYPLALLLIGGGMNYFGSHPKILYLPALGVCILIMYWTHQYVRNREAAAIVEPTKAIEQKNAGPCGTNIVGDGNRTSADCSGENKK